MKLIKKKIYFFVIFLNKIYGQCTISIPALNFSSNKEVVGLIIPYLLAVFLLVKMENIQEFQDSKL